MKTPLRAVLRRAATTLAAGTLLATGLSLAVAAPSQAFSPGCTISFTPDTIGPGEVTQASLTVNGDYEDYYGVVAINGVPGGHQTIGTSSSGSLPYSSLASMVTGTDPVVLDYRIFWGAFTRRAEPSGPLCHAQLTLRPAVTATPSTPTTPTTPTTPAAPTTGGKVTLTAPSSLPLSAGTAKLTATSTTDGPIALTSTTPKVCTISGDAATLRRAGVCKVTAAQAGATAVTTSIRVWATPVVPRRAMTPRVVEVLGRGEGALRVSATPATVCQTTGGAVALIDAGTCRITVRDHGHVVRRAKVAVALAENSAEVKHSLTQAAVVYFDYNSARLTDRGQDALRASVKKLRTADLVVVYGNTYGPGRNSKHSRALAQRRARAVADHLATLGVKAKATTVPLAMQQPVSKTPAKNRRAEVYFR